MFAVEELQVPVFLGCSTNDQFNFFNGSFLLTTLKNVEVEKRIAPQFQLKAKMTVLC